MLRAALLALFAGALTACGPRCKDLCDDCHEAPGRTASGSCPDACDVLDDLSSTSDCNDPWDAYVTCMDAACDPKGCVGERDTYADCIHGYCGAHPEDDRCDLVL
jgi:hypothetical protein